MVTLFTCVIVKDMLLSSSNYPNQLYSNHNASIPSGILPAYSFSMMSSPSCTQAIKAKDVTVRIAKSRKNECFILIASLYRFVLFQDCEYRFHLHHAPHPTYRETIRICQNAHRSFSTVCFQKSIRRLPLFRYS